MSSLIAYAPFAFLNQFLAIGVVAAALALVLKLGRIHPRYRRGLVFVIGLALAFQIIFLLAVAQFAEQQIVLRLQQEGRRTTARILSSFEASSSSMRLLRPHRNWSNYFDARCEYTDGNGRTWRGLVELLPTMPRSPGDSVAIRYLPDDPNVMRENDYVEVSRKATSKVAFLSLPWLANGIALLTIWLNARKRKRRALAMGRLDFPY